MPRARRAKPVDLTESWDAVDDAEERSVYEEGHNPQRHTTQLSTTAGIDHSTARAGRGSQNPGPIPPAANGQSRKKNARLSVEPDLVMPSSPDGMRAKPKQNMRESTPHFRLNERSMTSDAGKFNRNMRASTPHFRLNERSMTSDAGRFRGNAHDPEQEDDKRDAPTTAEGYPIIIWRTIRPLVLYCLDIVGLALRNAKPLLGWALLAYILFGGVIFGVNFLHNSVQTALTPLCRIPGASWLDLPFCPSSTNPEVSGPAEFNKLVAVQSAFDDVLATTAVGVGLPLVMKRSEASIRDLKHVVQYSSLASKNELVFEMVGFVDTARQASQDLSKFNSRIGRAVDQILSTNRWTLSVIDGVSASDSGRGSVSKWISSNLNIFAPFQPISLSRDVLLDQYLRHTSAVEEQIMALISEAQALLNILDNLDGRLDVIASIAAREDSKAQVNKDELFAYLWTKLGGNRSSVAKLEQQIQLLKEVGAYRRLAWTHVTTTITKLQAIRDNLEDLRERVALPETVGTDRVPLEVHIESINLGIERLEHQRDASRKVEAENYARVLSRVEEGDKRMIGGSGRTEL